MGYYFGVDGGGTKSRIRLIDSYDKILYEAEGGTTNIYAGETDAALQNLSTLVLKMLVGVNLSPEDITGACISSAGLDREAEKELFKAHMDSHVGLRCPTYYCNDGESLLVGGLGGLEGICLIAGTGSLGIGRIKSGKLVRAGGLGYMLGDEGSAFWLSHQAIIRTLRSIEDRDLKTDMLPDFLEFYGLATAPQFIALLHKDLRKSVIAASASIITRNAEEGDPLALDIIGEAVKELTSLLRSVIMRIPEITVKQVVFSGGVLEHDEFIKARLIESIEENFPDFIVTPRKSDAAAGSCLLAKQL